MSSPVVAYVGLGSNLGDSIGLLVGAIRALGGLPGTSVAACSGFYRTPAWGITDQPDFINAVAELHTALAPQALLTGMLDLLLYGDATIDDPGLDVPHPHLHERAFALVPLAEIAPDAAIPGRGPVRDALAAMAAGDIEALTYVAPPPSAAR